MISILLSPRNHGIVDYLAGVCLVTVPVILDVRSSSETALWLSVFSGVVLVAYSALTDYRLGLLRIIPFKVHLLLDLSAAGILFAAPLIFDWDAVATAYYFIMAAAVIVVVILTSTSETP